MSPKSVLILTNSKDGEHSDSVIRHLEASQQTYFRLDVDRFARGEIGVEVVSDSSQFSFSFFDGAKRVDSSDIISVWYRRPLYFDSPIKDEVQRKHAEKEIESLLEGLWRTAEGVFWMNSPKSLDLVRKKMPQLQMASRLGFRVPKTLVTNDPATAKQFIDDCPRGAIYKTIDGGCFDYGDKTFVVPTTLVTEGLKQQLALIRPMPALFQERIEKDYELRVTVVGEAIFSVRINSQKFEETSLDWRDPDFVMQLEYVPTTLPQDVTNSIRKMMDRMGISFGAFDFAVDRSGTHWFFEVNGNGQWYWLEHQTGLLISRAIADILTQGL